MPRAPLGTGQDQTHALVRSLQLQLPGISIWLDVEQLDNVGLLEAAVEKCMAFILFLSGGYFACERPPRTLHDRKARAPHDNHVESYRGQEICVQH